MSKGKEVQRNDQHRHLPNIILHCKRLRFHKKNMLQHHRGAWLSDQVHCSTISKTDVGVEYCYYCQREATMAFGQTFYWKNQTSYTIIHQETLKEMAWKHTSPLDADTHTGHSVFILHSSGFWNPDNLNKLLQPGISTRLLVKVVLM